MTVADLPAELFEDIQRIFRATPVLLVGSGFSCGYGMPGMDELGEHLASSVAKRLTSPGAISVWTAAVPAIKAGLEAGLNTIPNGVPGWDEIVIALRQETARYIIDRCSKSEEKIIADSQSKPLAPIRLLQRLYAGSPQNAECISVVTTNYDTLIELFCDLSCLPIDTGFEGFRLRRPRSSELFSTNYSRSWASGKRGLQIDHRICKTVRLYKPHGSIAWVATAQGPAEILNDLASPTRAIVVPGPTKYQDAMVNTLFDAMRTAMNAAMENASALLCIGFGFNDDHLQGVIRARLQTGMPAIILVRDLTENIRNLLKRFPHVIAVSSNGKGSHVHYGGATLFATGELWNLDQFLRKFLE